jgi:cytochrome c553
MRLTSVLVFAVLTVGPNRTLGQAESEEQLTTVATHMHEQLGQIGTIKSAIIAGRLEGVRESAIWLADHDMTAGLPADFEPFVAQIKTYARHIIEAEDLNAAAESVSKMARTCGECHSSNGVDLRFGYDQLPREDIEDVVTHMQRHQWATDRLWDGLIGPSDSAWNRGADMLIDVPLAAGDVTITTEHQAEITKMTQRIHALGGMAAAAVTSDARSELYGEVLGLCAGCHVLLGRGPANRQ